MNTQTQPITSDTPPSPRSSSRWFGIVGLGLVLLANVAIQGRVEGLGQFGQIVIFGVLAPAGLVLCLIASIRAGRERFWGRWLGPLGLFFGIAPLSSLLQILGVNPDPAAALSVFIMFGLVTLGIVAARRHR